MKDVKTLSGYVGFEVLTAVVMKSTIFWDVTPCSPLSFRALYPRRWYSSYKDRFLLG
jgi:hypothetical protein